MACARAEGGQSEPPRVAEWLKAPFLKFAFFPAPQDDRDSASQRMFAVARPVLGVVQIRAWQIALGYPRH
jgi:hypothetical protein